MILDLSIGDRFMFLSGKIRGTFEVTGFVDADPLNLTSVVDGEQATISRMALAVLQGNGGAIRTFRKGEAVRTLTAQELKGFHSPPQKSVLTDTEMKAWRIRQTDVKRAARLLFYVRAFDASNANKGDTELRALILRNYEDAKSAGFDDLPSVSSVRKAIAKGEPGRRSIGLYLRKRGGARSKTKFPGWVYELGQSMVGYYYSVSAINYKEAYKWFDERFYPRLEAWTSSEDRTEGARAWDKKPPTEETLRNWINEARSPQTLKMKYTEREASRLVRGRGQSFEPLAPMETIVLDQTLAPIWACEEIDVDGDVKIVTKRPWLVWAMDLYSRMVVGFVITFDPPCLATLMACLRQAITPKVEWVERFGECKGATDGFGALNRIILDNALAHIGVTMQFVGDVAGFNIVYAPVYTPDFKPWVERLIQTMHGPIRSLPGGIPRDDEGSELDARSTAALSLDAIERLMAHHIIAYHLESHGGIGMAPARKWVEGLEEFDRPMVDDARAFKLILRRYASAVLTAKGIQFKGHRFHDSGLVTQLLHDLRSRKRKKSSGQSDSIVVHVLWEPMDTSSLGVLNERTGEIVELPNHDKFYSETAVSYEFSAGERALQRQKNESFHTREEKARARAEFSRQLEIELASSSHGRGKSLIRVLHGKRKTLELGSGSAVHLQQTTPSITGMPKARSIPVGLALKDRVDEVSPVKGRTPRKSAKLKQKVKAPEALQDRIGDQHVSGEVPDDDNFQENSEAMLDDLEKRLGY